MKWHHVERGDRTRKQVIGLVSKLTHRVLYRAENAVDRASWPQNAAHARQVACLAQARANLVAARVKYAALMQLDTGYVYPVYEDRIAAVEAGIGRLAADVAATRESVRALKKAQGCAA